MQLLRMKKKWLFLFILGILILFLVGFYKFFNKQNTFCIPIKIEGFTDGNLPYINVEIEREGYPFVLDLGFNGDASIKSEYLEKIKNKIFIKKSYFYSFLGKEYENNIYEIPQLKIGRLKFHPVTLDEENKNFHDDTEIVPAKDETLVKAAGSLGWRLFHQVTLCLDINFSMIGICDSIETFKKELHPLDTFSRVPLLNDHDFIEFEVITPNGPMKCLLDSGFTSNCLNTVQPSDQPLGQLITNEKYAIKYETFQIGSKDFGPIIFRPISLNFPFHVDAILGREFLADHVVVIDFINREIYIAKSERKD